MTLTLKTAKHAIDKHGKIFNIVKDFDDPTELTNGAVTRDEIEDIGEYDPNFKPCIVVTTAREALEAAWELAYETARIPARTPYIFRAQGVGVQTVSGQPGDIYAGHGRMRLIDPPASEPEPWELSRFCYADGDVYKRYHDASGVHWMRPGHERYYQRKDLAKRSPRPVTIEGDEQ